MKTTKLILFVPRSNNDAKNIAFAIRERGSTLIEVLISMLILSMGIIALVSTQTRIAMGIREAENISRVAQAAQNMAEAMLIKPTLESVDEGNEGGESKDNKNIIRLNKNYSAYKIHGCGSTSEVKASLKAQDQWVDSVKEDFCAAIKKIVGAKSDEALSENMVVVRVENNKRLDDKVEECTRPEGSQGAWSLKDCNPLKEGHQTVLQVIWKMDEESNFAYNYQVVLGE